MKLAQVRMVALSGPDASALATTVNAWIAANGRERTLLNISFVASVGALTACIVYTE